MSLDRATAAPRRQRGFTLVELLITMVILGILGVIAVPSFLDATLSNRLSSLANSFSASLKIARSEAIKRNASVTMCRSSTGSSCATTGTWQQGWIVFADTNGNGSVDGSEQRFVYETAQSPDFVFSSTGGGVYTLVFKGTGLSSTAETVTICRSSPTVGNQKRTIEIDLTGRPTVTRVSGATTCP